MGGYIPCAGNQTYYHLQKDEYYSNQLRMNLMNLTRICVHLLSTVKKTISLLEYQKNEKPSRFPRLSL
jgi:hypothetical protein